MHDRGKYRGITLLSPVLKLLDRVLDARIRRRVECDFGKNRNGSGKEQQRDGDDDATVDGSTRADVRVVEGMYEKTMFSNSGGGSRGGRRRSPPRGLKKFARSKYNAAIYRVIKLAIS